MATLTPDKIRYEHGLKICEKIIPWGAVWTKSYQSYKKGDKYKSDRYFEGNKPSYITIHNTDGNANAETYTRATYPNQNMGTVRVHYYVDDNEAWQNLREDEIGWHAGTGGLGPGNRDSIGIEIIMCGSKIKNDIQAEENGALLAAILLDRYGLGTDKLRTHKDWSGKQCPLYILPHWDSFVKSVERHLEQIKGNASTPQPEPAPKPEEPADIKVGSIVKVTSGAKSYEGTKIASFVFENTYRVDELKGDRAVLDLTGICTAFHTADLSLVQTGGSDTAPDTMPVKYRVSCLSTWIRKADAPGGLLEIYMRGKIVEVVGTSGRYSKIKYGKNGLEFAYIPTEYIQKV